mmetsp:Transcript_42424/g.30611  ORF Transcript_42424/g.30611 Transcript_42424/m.30611 type:complete len:176 (-) Transcript_42424:147-674(-)
MFFLFRRPTCLLTFFLADESNQRMLKHWMSFSSTCDHHLKVSLLASLRELLTKRDQVDYTQLDLIIRRITSNLTKAGNFPDQGKDTDTVRWLLESADCPDDDEQLLSLQVILQYIEYSWGQQALLNDKKSVDYLTRRDQAIQPILQQKYAVVDKALKKTVGANIKTNLFDSGLVD